jgi:hypothetical protein
MNAKKIADLLIDMWEQGNVPSASAALQDYTTWLGTHWQTLDTDARAALLSTGTVMMDAMLKESWGEEVSEHEAPEALFQRPGNDAHHVATSDTLVSLS